MKEFGLFIIILSRNSTHCTKILHINPKCYFIYCHKHGKLFIRRSYPIYSNQFHRV